MPSYKEVSNNINAKDLNTTSNKEDSRLIDKT